MEKVSTYREIAGTNKKKTVRPLDWPVINPYSKKEKGFRIAVSRQTVCQRGREICKRFFINQKPSTNNTILLVLVVSFH